MNGNTSAQVAAVVQRDPSNAGVKWSCKPVGNCGSFNPAQTASGAPTTFTAPAAAGDVTVVATSVTDSTKSASAVVHVAAAAPISVAITQAPPADMNVNTTAQVIATVQNDPTNSVNWSCTPVNTCGSFNPTQTTSGTATTYTAPGNATNVTITATSVTDNTKFQNAAVTVTVPMAFYVAGYENINTGANFYGVAGAVTLDVSGNVVSGVQDYNDAQQPAPGRPGLLSPQPAGDAILGGKLSVNANGQGSLTLQTNNPNLGVGGSPGPPVVGGTETLGVQFVNSNHALIVQFDGTATSSGSLDFQTLPSVPSGAFSFTLTGVDSGYGGAVAGGVMSISGANIQNGTIDVNDFGVVTTKSLTGTISAANSFGRGTITFSAGPFPQMSYYVVGPKAVRLIVVPQPPTPASFPSAVGSAFSQGAGTFNNASLGKSVFSLESSSYGDALYAAAGMFSTSNTGANPANFSGIADDDESGTVVSGAAIAGTYTIASNGYGSLTITPGSLGSVSSVGVYMTDPALNLNDPNSTTTSLGGALIADMDTTINGTGFLIPQSDTATTSFAGNYAFGAQNYYTAGPGWEFDFVGEGSMAAGTLSGTGLVSDPVLHLGASAANSGVPFSINPAPYDAPHGRYGPSTLAMTIGGTVQNLKTVVYQASGNELVWINEDTTNLFGGIVQKQTLPLVAPAIAIRPPLAPPD